MLKAKALPKHIKEITNEIPAKLNFNIGFILNILVFKSFPSVLLNQFVTFSPFN
jgi:hypothetical protein